MYLNEKWGRDSLHENMVTRLKFVLRAKEGKKVQGKLLYNFIQLGFRQTVCRITAGSISPRRNTIFPIRRIPNF